MGLALSPHPNYYTLDRDFTYVLLGDLPFDLRAVAQTLETSFAVLNMSQVPKGVLALGPSGNEEEGVYYLGRRKDLHRSGSRWTPR